MGWLFGMVESMTGLSISDRRPVAARKVLFVAISLWISNQVESMLSSNVSMAASSSVSLKGISPGTSTYSIISSRDVQKRLAVVSSDA